MMVLAISALLLSAFDTTAPAMPTPALSEIFVAACLDGKVALSKGEAAAVAIDKLPRILRKRLGKPASGQAWRLNSPGRAFLYVLDYSPSPGVDPKVCGLASDELSFDAAADVLEMRISGEVLRDRGKGIQLLMPQDGYAAIATRAGAFSIVQINWMTEADSAATAKRFRAVTP